jgi:hypothetical protein
LPISETCAEIGKELVVLVIERALPYDAVKAGLSIIVLRWGISCLVAPNAFSVFAEYAKFMDGKA